MVKKMKNKNTSLSTVIFLVAFFSASIYIVATTPPPYSKGLFWEISKDGEMLGHIYGTIHMNDERVTRVPKKVMERVAG